jgi:uroporphyrinogen III methyltransferase/synthase
MIGMRSKVYLTGAGPGDPDLITLKGLESIRKASVIIYDRLVSQKLLEYASPYTQLIYVGKAPGKHTMKQEEINDLLVQRALEGHIVTRLKGGDPFVFGRGGEEALCLALRGIPFEIIPGITSATAVPAYAGIPVTHRGIASSFLVVTGHECPEKLESTIDWGHTAASDTIVFLMGVANLPRIVKELLHHGKSADTPIALIQRGTYQSQKTIVGTLVDIQLKQERERLQSPVTIVVGPVVKLREKLGWFEADPPAWPQASSEN